MSYTKKIETPGCDNRLKQFSHVLFGYSWCHYRTYLFLGLLKKTELDKSINIYDFKNQS